MRSPLLFTLALMACAAECRGQLLAGEIPSGSTAFDLNIDLQLSTPFTADSADLEIDCDDYFDLRAVLICGSPAIDAPNIALLRMIDNDLELCADGVPFYSRPQYYADGQPLNCTGAFDWQFEDTTVLGDFGGFSAIGPSSVDSLYVAVRRGDLVSWIHLSFELSGPVARLQAHRVLSFCGLTTAMPEAQADPGILSPTITSGEPVFVNARNGVRGIVVLDASGRVIARHGAGTVRIEAPATAGVHCALLELADGRTRAVRFVRE